MALFLQKRPHRAGAQVALARLLAESAFQSLNPILVTTRKGWLTDECDRLGVRTLVIPFPTSRSAIGRLFSNRMFARRVVRELRERSWEPRLIVGNDHYEGLLADRIARLIGARRVMFLRSADASLDDLKKYRCDDADLIYAVGEVFVRDVARWLPASAVHGFLDGLSEADFFAPKRKSHEFPRRILVVGSEHPLKGWADFAAAIDLLEQDRDFPALDFDFTGKAPDPAANDMKLSAARRSRFNFIGRREKFAELVREYDLVIHPTLLESFGLASFEVLAAGVPLLCSRTGEIEKVSFESEWLFAPGNVRELADRIRALHDRWPDIPSNVEASQKRIRERFMVGAAAEKVVGEMWSLLREIEHGASAPQGA